LQAASEHLRLFFQMSHAYNHPSRRGSPTSSDISILLLHPNHVHVPVPSIAPPQVAAKKSTRAKYVRLGDKALSPLHNDAVPVLEQHGLLAANLSLGLRKWQGIVRVPEKDGKGQWLNWRERLRAIEDGTGTFRRLKIQ